jgi:hypothetical protein
MRVPLLRLRRIESHAIVNIDVATCFVLTGISALIGAALMFLVRTDDLRVRQAVSLCKISLSLLSAKPWLPLHGPLPR